MSRLLYLHRLMAMAIIGATAAKADVVDMLRERENKLLRPHADVEPYPTKQRKSKGERKRERWRLK